MFQGIKIGGKGVRECFLGIRRLKSYRVLESRESGKTVLGVGW